MADQTDLHVVLGTGPAGSTLATELVARGHRVRCVNRSGDGFAAPGVEPVAADLTQSRAAERATVGASVIYHCVNVAYHRQVDVMPDVATAVLSAAAAAGARLVVLDTLYPYGTAEGERITEQTPWAATTRKGKLRADLDRRYLAAHRAGSVRFAAGRSADFFGPAVLNSTLGGAVFPAALAGQPVLALGDIDLPHSYSYIRDIARGLATLGEDPAGDGRIWHLPTVPATTTRHIHQLITENIGGPLEVHTLESARPYGPFDETFMTEYDEMFYQHTTPQNMDSSAFQSQFGMRPTPLGEALDATIDWYREFLRQG